MIKESCQQKKKNSKKTLREICANVGKIFLIKAKIIIWLFTKKKQTHFPYEKKTHD